MTTFTSTADDDRRDVLRVRNGEVALFAALVDRHQGRLLCHLRRLVGWDDAEDLVQETFVRAFQALDRYDPTYPLRAWLLIIASRLAANHVSRRREPCGTLPEAAAPDHHDPATVCAEQDALADLQRRLDRALAALPLEARTLYELRFRQDLDLPFLARHLGISGNALKVRIHRLRTALATQLGIPMGSTP